MRKTWFDVRLFREAMRQMRIPGLLAGLVLILQAILIPVGTVINGLDEGGVELVGLFHINPLSLSLYCVIAPLMALYLFRFLSQRSACDFYHAIPQTRICLYISFAAAVFCWALLLQVSSTLTGILMHLCFPAHFRVDLMQILLYSVQLYACVIFVVGAVLLAVTLTGSTLTNLAVSLLIIFFPRLIMIVAKTCVGGSLTIVGDRYLSFLGHEWNVVTGSVFSALQEGENLFSNLRAGAYTAGIGIGYLIIGALMFDRRRSESAGEASVNPRLQLIFRLLPAAVFCLIPSVQIFRLLIGENESTAGEWYSLFVLYLIGVFIYFLYELISTRKLRNLLKAAPGLVFLAAFNLLVIFGLLGLRRNLLSYQPEASEIDSVQLVSSEVYIWNGEEGKTIPGYLTTRASQIELTDENVKQLISLRLKETVEYDNLPESEKQFERDCILKQVAIHSGKQVHYRNIRMMQSDIQELAEVLKKDSRMKEIYMNLPDGKESNVSLTLESGQYYSSGESDIQKATSVEMERIMKALKEDAADMGFEDWYSYCTTAEDYDFTLYMTVREGGQVTGSAFPVGNDTPKAKLACMKILSDQQKEARQELLRSLQTYQDYLNDPDSGMEVTYCEGYVSLVPEDGEGEALEVDLMDKAQVRELMRLLESRIDQPVGESVGYMDVHVYLEYVLESGQAEDFINTSDSYTMYSGTILLPLPEKADLSGIYASDSDPMNDLLNALEGVTEN